MWGLFHDAAILRVNEQAPCSHYPALSISVGRVLNLWTHLDRPVIRSVDYVPQNVRKGRPAVAGSLNIGRSRS